MGLTKATNTKKKVGGGWFDKLDNAFYIWFCQEREKGSPITGTVLLEKASELHSIIYGEHYWSFLARISV